MLGDGASLGKTLVRCAEGVEGGEWERDSRSAALRLPSLAAKRGSVVVSASTVSQSGCAESGIVDVVVPSEVLCEFVVECGDEDMGVGCVLVRIGCSVSRKSLNALMRPALSREAGSGGVVVCGGLLS